MRAAFAVSAGDARAAQGDPVSALRLATTRDAGKRSSTRLLIDAAKRRPVSVVVVMTDDDGMISVCSSFQDRLRLIGALEAAKQDLWDD